MPKRNDLEQKALHYVINTGYQGVLQSDLWRELSASSREGSRVSIKLEEKGLIRREKELQDGRWTYRLYPKRLPKSIATIADCPCLLCPDNAKCDPTTTVSPKNCQKLTDWILGLDNQQVQNEPDFSNEISTSEDDSIAKGLDT
ncbi:MAG: transcriptional regulator [Candidatus Bathyarchaeota archaeon]|nr:transcriptional regulator [Candidatus Termiticorpusculum sp.]MCL1970452.1 transcriptional regulator [Candidatus Termiticorpusculum sp.]